MQTIEQGIPGPEGAQGEKGDKGDKGDPGTSSFGQLKVINKVVYPEGYPHVYDSSDFTMTVDTQFFDAVPSNFVGSEIGIDVAVGIGEYSVTNEVPDMQFDVLYSSDCSGTMRQGETKVCTITNMYRNLIVIKEFEISCHRADRNCPDVFFPDPDPSASFTLTVEGNNPIPSTFQGSSSGSRITIGIGEYSITEIEPSSSQRGATFHGDCSGIIQPGDIKTCRIINILNLF